MAETRQVNCECSCRSAVTAKGIKEEIKLRTARAQPAPTLAKLPERGGQPRKPLHQEFFLYNIVTLNSNQNKYLRERETWQGNTLSQLSLECLTRTRLQHSFPSSALIYAASAGEQRYRQTNEVHERNNVAERIFSLPIADCRQSIADSQLSCTKSQRRIGQILED